MKPVSLLILTLAPILPKRMLSKFFIFRYRATADAFVDSNQKTLDDFMQPKVRAAAYSLARGC